MAFYNEPKRAMQTAENTILHQRTKVNSKIN